MENAEESKKGCWVWLLVVIFTIGCVVLYVMEGCGAGAGYIRER
jgi:hypothetical protein